tara:strand:+ start:21902 stop:22324 length:423 start_codon:yes stop_codon:yes gene_type:complete
MSEQKLYSIDDLDATKLGETPFDFEFMNQDGTGTGIILSVLGSEVERVQKVIAELINERRKKEAVRKMNESFRNKKTAEFEPLESDLEFGQRLAAIRLVGWKNLIEDWSPEEALRLCRKNKEVAAQVTEASDNSGNFLNL